MLSRLKSAAADVFDVVGATARLSDAANGFAYRANLKLRAAERKLSERCPDGFRLPPPHLVFKVSGSYQRRFFFEGGALGARCIDSILQKNGLSMEDFDSVLDFGCGCGRIIRHWKGRVPHLHGSDYNPDAIEWCGRELPFASFALNQLEPPLPYADATFDFICSISVFTHLTEDLQHAWMDELMRVIKPGGHVLWTAHGVTRRDSLSGPDQHAFDAGEVVVRRGRYAGHNFCHTYHPESWVYENLVQHGTEALDFVPGGLKDANQDAFLFRKDGLASVSALRNTA